MDIIVPDQNTSGANVAYTGTAGSTTTFNPVQPAVYVYVTTDAYIRVGEGVTATTADLPVPAYTPVVLQVPKGTGSPWRVSAIQVAAGGTLYVKPVSGYSA
jgi:hypothetical protein